MMTQSFLYIFLIHMIEKGISGLMKIGMLHDFTIKWWFSKGLPKQKHYIIASEIKFIDLDRLPEIYSNLLYNSLDSFTIFFVFWFSLVKIHPYKKNL